MITVKYVEKSLDEQINSIKMFLAEQNEMSDYLVNYFHLTDYFHKAEEEKNLMLHQKFGELYRNNKDILAHKVDACQKQWEKHESFINTQFQNIFGKDFDFNCIARVNFNPICPRFIESKEFDVNALDNNAGILETSLHEIVHFAWFNDWNEQFPNTSHADMNAPSLGWLISEIAVDPILRNSELNRFLVRNPAYDYLYKEKINDKNMMEVVNELYVKCPSIKVFQNQMINLIQVKERQTYSKEPEQER